jgi:hypothetical protein
MVYLIRELKRLWGKAEDVGENGNSLYYIILFILLYFIMVDKTICY